MVEINMWTYQKSTLPVCYDPVLDDGKGLNYPEGNSKGQAGWNVSVGFDTIYDLSSQIYDGVTMPSSFCSNVWDDCPKSSIWSINRLAIKAHGAPGEIWINGEGQPALSTDTLPTYEPLLRKIGIRLAYPRSLVLITSCLAGQGTHGTELLRMLSDLWPYATVVAFSTQGYSSSYFMKRSGDSCNNPGERSTDNPTGSFSPSEDDYYKHKWGDYVAMPWASEKSPYAKVVRGGEVLKWPLGEEPNYYIGNGRYRMPAN